jgi:DNA invertase Pin-like site-specific DNA recombinase
MERQLNSLSAQMDFQRQDILDHPMWEYIDTYTDIGSGRSINSRPGFKRLMAVREAGKIDLIFTKSISRLGRNCVDFLIVLRRLKELGVDVYFQNEGIFLSNETSELILSLHAALAQAESEDKSTNIRWGIKKSTSNPDSPAFSRPCFGYVRNEEKMLVINEQEARIVRMIFGWYEQGWSIVRIKKELETLRIPSPRGMRRWAVRTISDILSNEKYAGDSAYGKTIIAEYPSTRRVKNSPDQISRTENHHPAIINKSLFDLVQEMKRIRTNVEVNERGNKVRKNTHYSMKRPLDILNDQTEAEEA